MLSGALAAAMVLRALRAHAQVAVHAPEHPLAAPAVVAGHSRARIGKIQQFDALCSAEIDRQRVDPVRAQGGLGAADGALDRPGPCAALASEAFEAEGVEASEHLRHLRAGRGLHWVAA